MRFSVFAGLLALCSPIVSSLATTKADTATVSASQALSVVNSLQSTLLPYAKDINTTIAALGPSPSAAQKDAAAQAVREDAQAMSSAVSAAIDALHPAPALQTRQTQDPVTAVLGAALQDLYDLITYSANTITTAFGTGDPLQIAGSLLAPVDYVIFIVAFAFLGGEPFLGGL